MCHICRRIRHFFPWKHHTNFPCVLWPELNKAFFGPENTIIIPTPPYSLFPLRTILETLAMFCEWKCGHLVIIFNFCADYKIILDETYERLLPKLLRAINQAFFIHVSENNWVVQLIISVVASHNGISVGQSVWVWFCPCLAYTQLAGLLTALVFWDMMIYHWVNGYCCFKGSLFLIFSFTAWPRRWRHSAPLKCQELLT